MRQVLRHPLLQTEAQGAKWLGQDLSPEPWSFLSAVSATLFCEAWKLWLGILRLWQSPRAALVGSAPAPSSGSLGVAEPGCVGTPSTPGAWAGPWAGARAGLASGTEGSQYLRSWM